MSGDWRASFDVIRGQRRRSAAGARTPREQLAAAVWQAMRGLRTPSGSASRETRVAEILAACDAYAASAPVPEGTRR